MKTFKCVQLTCDKELTAAELLKTVSREDWDEAEAFQDLGHRSAAETYVETDLAGFDGEYLIAVRELDKKPRVMRVTLDMVPEVHASPFRRCK